MTGRASVSGIYFDFDKGTIKPGSEKALFQVGKLMKAQPDSSANPSEDVNLCVLEDLGTGELGPILRHHECKALHHVRNGLLFWVPSIRL